MKFIHIADVHLGAIPDAGKVWAKEREKEIWETFEKIVPICNNERADLLLISGDLFHRQPLKKELKEVNYILSKLVQTQVVIIAGSYDYLKESSRYLDFEWHENIHFLTNTQMDKVYFPLIDTEVWGLSYNRPQITEALYDEVSVKKDRTYRILMAYGGDENHIPMKLNQLAQKEFHYIALGYFHTPKLFEQQRMAYSGALEPIEKSETGKHGYIIGEILEDGTKISFVPIAKREYVSLKVTMTADTTNQELKERIQSVIEECGDNNIYKVIIEGKHDSDKKVEVAQLFEIGNVLEVIDKTVPEYNLLAIYNEHKEDIIGKYMEALQAMPANETNQKALFYGLEALMSD